jgi:hypothetical protein
MEFQQDSPAESSTLHSSRTAHTEPRVSQVRGVQTALPHTRNQGFPKYEVSKLHYRTHGTKGFPSTRCPNCTIAHTEPRVSRFQTSQLLSEPRATQAEPGFIPSLIYNTNKKTGWRNRSTSRILKGGRGDSLDNRNLNKLLLGKVRSLYTEINYQPHRKNVPKYFKTILSKVRQSRLHGTPHKTCSRIVNIYIEHVTES